MDGPAPLSKGAILRANKRKLERWAQGNFQNCLFVLIVKLSIQYGEGGYGRDGSEGGNILF